jgi:hypothetical protein
MIRRQYLFALFAALICLAGSACGGGGSDSNGSSSTTAQNSSQPPAGQSTPPGAPPGPGASQSDPSTTLAANQIAVTVGNDPFGIANMLMTSVTICAPGTSTCQTIPNVQVDTGSHGLRLFASNVTIPIARISTGLGKLAECAAFGSGLTWGSVAQFDVHLGGETAPNTPIQLIGDSTVGSAPSVCTQTGLDTISTTAALGANGILGVGLKANDCGSACATSTSNTPSVYVNCISSPFLCNSQTTVPLNQQVSNPVALFANDNNGVILQLPALPATGAASVSGVMTFGIGTQVNNGLGAAQVYTLSSANAEYPLQLLTSYQGVAYNNSFIDSGSNGLFFPNKSIPQCKNGDYASWYCPSSPLAQTATIQGANGRRANIGFSIANADTLVRVNHSLALNDIGAPLDGTFDWGLPFFFGRTVYTAIAGRQAGSSTGPFFAF